MTVVTPPNEPDLLVLPPPPPARDARLKPAGQALSSARGALAFHLSKSGVILSPVFIQKLLSNLSGEHKEGRLGGFSDPRTFRITHPAPPSTPAMHHGSGSQTPERKQMALTNASSRGDGGGQTGGDVWVPDAAGLPHSTQQLS